MKQLNTDVLFGEVEVPVEVLYELKGSISHYRRHHQDPEANHPYCEIDSVYMGSSNITDALSQKQLDALHMEALNKELPRGI